ncbi:hypothetical protein BG004_000002 [Podila humilis]|nr:hypothetical protein BG004_000002 [Podila humilis]
MSDLHPHVNRTLENSDLPRTQSVHTTPASMSTKTATKGACQCGKNEWDLHPACIRKIENEGSPSDVKQLHNLEQQCNRNNNIQNLYTFVIETLCLRIVH